MLPSDRYHGELQGLTRPRTASLASIWHTGPLQSGSDAHEGVQDQAMQLVPGQPMVWLSSKAADSDFPQGIRKHWRCVPHKPRLVSTIGSKVSHQPTRDTGTTALHVPSRGPRPLAQHL